MGPTPARWRWPISGALDDAIELGRRGHDAHVALGTGIRFRPEAQFIGSVLALCGAGRLGEADVLASRGHDAAVTAHDTDLEAAFALLSGLVAVHGGRLISARRHFDEAAALYRELDDVAALRWALGGVALAAGMGSDSGASTAAVAELATAWPNRRCNCTISTTSSAEEAGRWRPMGSGREPSRRFDVEPNAPPRPGYSSSRRCYATISSASVKHAPSETGSPSWRGGSTER